MDGKTFGAELADMIKQHVAKSIEPLEARIKELEAQVAQEKSEKRKGLFR